MYVAFIKTPIGLIKAVFDNSLAVKRISLTDESGNPWISEFAADFTNQLKSYFKGEALGFNYPVNLGSISSFDKTVIELVRQIPYGETVTYNWIAKRLDTAPRAIGQALKRNPLPIIIPCHRVIKSDGTLGGYSLGVEIKRWLIEHEKSVVLKKLSS